jgi:hypothetical protein
MKELRAAAKAAPSHADTKFAHEKTDSQQRKRKRKRCPETSESGTTKDTVSEKRESAAVFPYDVDASDHAETPAGAPAPARNSFAHVTNVQLRMPISCPCCVPWLHLLASRPAK